MSSGFFFCFIFFHGSLPLCNIFHSTRFLSSLLCSNAQSKYFYLMANIELAAVLTNAKRFLSNLILIPHSFWSFFLLNLLLWVLSLNRFSYTRHAWPFLYLPLQQMSTHDSIIFTSLFDIPYLLAIRRHSMSYSSTKYALTFHSFSESFSFGFHWLNLSM